MEVVTEFGAVAGQDAGAGRVNPGLLKARRVPGRYCVSPYLFEILKPFFRQIVRIEMFNLEEAYGSQNKL
jgi:hypothetical protein